MSTIEELIEAVRHTINVHASDDDVRASEAALDVLATRLTAAEQTVGAVRLALHGAELAGFEATLQAVRFLVTEAATAADSK